LSWQNTSGRIFSPVSPKKVPNVFLPVTHPCTFDCRFRMAEPGRTVMGVRYRWRRKPCWGCFLGMFEGDLSRVVSRCYQQFFPVLRPVLLYCKLWRERIFKFSRTLFLKNSAGIPFFLQKGWSVQRGGRCPPFLGKRGLPPISCQIFDTENTDRVFLRYGIGNTGEIPTKYRPKIPNWYTTLDLS